MMPTHRLLLLYLEKNNKIESKLNPRILIQDLAGTLVLILFLSS